MGDFNPYVNLSNDSNIGQLTNVLPHRSTASNGTDTNDNMTNNYHPWGIFFTILGTVLLDFDADACQSPSRAYLLDVTVPGKEMFLNE